VKRIVLDRIPQRRNPQLPPYTEIDHPVIREAAAAWDGARSTLTSARQEVVELEQTAEQAQWADAEAAEKARAEGKAEPKRTHIAAHEKKLDQARHEAKVAELAEDRAFNDLQSALDEHTATWAASVDADVQALDDEWQNALAALTTLHERRSSALAIRSMVVGETPNAGAVGFTAWQIMNVELASGQAHEKGYVQTGDVLAGLAALGAPKSLGAETPQQHRPPMGRDRLAAAHAEGD
jgi:hypothetical protein